MYYFFVVGFLWIIQVLNTLNYNDETIQCKEGFNMQPTITYTLSQLFHGISMVILFFVWRIHKDGDKWLQNPGLMVHRLWWSLLLQNGMIVFWIIEFLTHKNFGIESLITISIIMFFTLYELRLMFTNHISMTQKFIIFLLVCLKIYFLYINIMSNMYC